MDETFEPTQADWQALNERRQLAELRPEERDALVRVERQNDEQAARDEENQDWILSHPELYDGDD